MMNEKEKDRKGKGKNMKKKNSTRPFNDPARVVERFTERVGRQTACSQVAVKKIIPKSHISGLRFLIVSASLLAHRFSNWRGRPYPPGVASQFPPIWMFWRED